MSSVAIDADTGEDVRLVALNHYQILDTPPDKNFDDIVVLAAKICRAPVSLVSLVTDDRQWFKARAGFELCQTPLRDSVCSHTMRQADVLVIPDLSQDPRTKNNALVVGEPKIRFYAGARLESTNGQPLGALCVIDTKPRPEGLTEDQTACLELLAKQVMTQIELHRIMTMRDKALRHTQRMESLGQMTSGITHDFNNILMSLNGAIRLMGRKISEGRYKEVERYLAMAQASVTRATALTRRLLAFSRQRPATIAPIEPKQVVADMMDLIRSSIGEGITLTLDNAAEANEAWKVLADPSQLENALLNLCINGRDAMPSGGTITVRLKDHGITADTEKPTDLPAGQYYSIRVTDTGVGMTPEVQSHVFEPFYTTKGEDKGTGLGMPMVKSFITQAKGHIRVESEIDVGTSVCLYLPRWVG